MSDPNIPMDHRATLDDEYSEWVECSECLGEWEGDKCLCDCYLEDISEL